jgi:hypothetical protein
MDTVTTQLAQLALSSTVLGGVVPFLVGVVIVGVLIWAVSRGRRIREREPAPPRPGEQPRPPGSGPVHEVRERREPMEVPRGRRLTPHRLWGHVGGGSRRAAEQRAPTWDEKSSGGFGSGGPGRT